MPAGGGSALFSLTNVNGTLFFSADDGIHGRELWKSDGTAAGTVLVKDINPGSGGSELANLTNINGTLFFSLDYGTSGAALWKSDGTKIGTVLVKHAVAGEGSLRELTNVKGTLVFGAHVGECGRYTSTDGALWKSDGTEAGTVIVAPDIISMWAKHCQPASITPFDFDLV